MADDRTHLNRNQDPEPRFTFGPDFETETGSGSGRLTSWLKANARTITVIGIVAVLVIGGLATLNRNRFGKLGDLFRARGPATVEESFENVDLNVPASTEAQGQTETKGLSLAEPGKITKTDTSITVAASRGEGVTHLARRALKSYLESNSADFDLKAEHKIYIEDYVMKKIGAKSLSVGEERQFSNDLVKDAMAKAKNLTPKQLENLSQYVPLVPSLR
ncbi:hypothetical protein HYZ80_01360 [Candidatus Parcubacteria bacterium]|nr:hypothetical protein [Candidatus Parcubacteria bacterium]